MSKAILFVCLGNICRSPTAEAVLRRLAEQAGLPLTIDSAGTGNWHVGEPPHPPMIKAAKARGYDLSPLRARQINPEDFQRFDRIFVMDDRNLRDVMALRQSHRLSETATWPERLLDLVPELGLTEVPDPYYSGAFDQTISLCETACRRLITDLQGHEAQ
ncbi:low molecular weight protein-tyrosine-phosphatase [Thioclava sp. FR2]|uniref:low molecular weight protein-tyrosine-phosphatase n=1 Tax=Thioclava sp. FR2 TaxID=3445780 RepID=UPI003EBCF1CD